MRTYLRSILLALGLTIGVPLAIGLAVLAADDVFPSAFIHVTNWVVAVAANDTMPTEYAHITNLGTPGSPGMVPQLLSASAVQSQINNPGDTNEHTLQTITVPANTLGANGCLFVDTLWSVTGSTNSKTLRVRFSGASGTAYSVVAFAGSNVTQRISTKICNRNATNSQVGSPYDAAGGWGQAATGNGTLITSAVDTTAATTLLLTCQLVTGTEQCGVEAYSVTVQ